MRSGRESASILRFIIQSILAAALLTGVVILTLKFGDRLLIGHHFTWPHSLLIRAELSSEGAINLFSTLALISATFLGLYFTAVSVVVSTIYARVPGDIRSLLLHEKIGNIYIGIVAFLGGTSVILLAASAMGFQVGLFNTILMVSLGTMAILSFVELGKRAFYFFDPTALVDYLVRDLTSQIESATPIGFRWQEFSFQAHYQRQAERVLRTYRNLVDIMTIDKNASGESLAILAQKALILLEFYEEQKLSIPTTSHWFERVYQHREWLTSDYAQIDIALKTGTALQPEEIPDPYWFETHIEDIISRIIKALIERNDIRGAIAVTNSVRQTLEALGGKLAIEEAIRMLRTVRPLVRLQIRQIGFNSPGVNLEAEQITQTLALVNLGGLAWTNVFLGVSRRLRTKAINNFGKEISEINWGKPATIYSLRLPSKVVEQLEYIHKRLGMELSVEGKLISPLWYRQQLAALAYVRFIDSQLTMLATELNITFAEEASTLIKEKCHLVASQVVQEGLEACNKFLAHLPNLEDQCAELTKLQRVTDIPWTSLNWDQLKKNISATRERIVILFAQCATALAVIPHRKEWPDYFGQAYSVLADECFKALHGGNEALFKQIFPSFFQAGIAAYGRLKESLKNQDVQTAFTFTTEPLVDILDLSGYALIYSELDGKQHWDIVKRAWDDYLTTFKNPMEITTFISSVIDRRETVFGLMPRAIIRTSWQQALEQRLRQDNLLDDYFGYRSFSREGSARARHKSAIIRALIDGRMMSDKAQDVFLAVYLSGRPEKEQAPFPNGATSFLESLRRKETQRQTP